MGKKSLKIAEPTHGHDGSLCEKGANMNLLRFGAWE
jgi:hypothetical protein